MKIPPVEASLLYEDGRTDVWSDGQTDMTKLIVTFHNFMNSPNNRVSELNDGE